MDDLLEWGRKVLASQPFSVLLGAELTGFGRRDRAPEHNGTRKGASLDALLADHP
jgi:hypothetical protein